MKTIKRMRVILTSVLIGILFSAFGKSKTDSLEASIIHQGQARLSAVQAQNAINDLQGATHLNQYLVVVGPEQDFPDADHLSQRKGVDKNGNDVGHYLMDQSTLDEINATLLLINNRSEIKAYVLVVNYMPVMYEKDVPLDFTLETFLSHKKEDPVSTVSLPVRLQAKKLVDGITNGIVQSSQSPILYCGFVNFRIYGDSVERFNQWVYYPNRGKIDFDLQYRDVLSTRVGLTTWPSSDLEKIRTLVDVIGKHNDEYKAATGLFKDIEKITSPVDLANTLEGLSPSVLSGLTVHQRIYALKVLSGGVMPNDREVLILNLLNTAHYPRDADSLLLAMRQVNDKVAVHSGKDGWCLLQCLTRGLSDATAGVIGTDSYNKFIKSIISICRYSKVFQDQVKVLEDATLNLQADRTIFYNYNSFWRKFASTIASSSSSVPGISIPSIDQSTSYAGACELQTKSELFFTYITPNTTLSQVKLDPFEPVVFVNQSDLGMLEDLPATQDMFVSPAIVLLYADAKAWSETATDVSMAAIDAASLATGYGEIKAGITGIRKAWVLMDMSNAGVNLALNISLASENKTVQAVMNAYNLCTGAATVSRMLEGGIRSVTAAVRESNALSGTNVLKFVKSVEDGDVVALRLFGEDDLKSIEALATRINKEAAAKGLTELSRRTDAILTKIEAAGILKRLTAKVPEELMATFAGDFGNNIELLRRFEKEEGLVEAWTTLKNASVEDAIRRGTNGELDYVLKYHKDFPDLDIAQQMSDAGGYQKWVDLMTFVNKSIAQKVDDISNAWKAVYPQVFVERKFFEDIMANYRYSKSAGWGHTADIANNFKAIDFYKDYTAVGTKIYSSSVISMKTTTTKNVDVWLEVSRIKSNLDNLVAGKVNGIEWNGVTIFYKEAEVHIYMPQENITDNLRREWLDKLNLSRPGIKFEINALENFIN